MDALHAFGSAAAVGTTPVTAAPPAVPRMVVATGNVMIDQFKPWYFGVAFAFLFKYCTGMPDMQEFAEEKRYRLFPKVHHEWNHRPGYGICPDG